MVDITSEIRAALELAGLHATAAFSLSMLPRLSAPMIAVYPTEAVEETAVLDDFLYTDTDGNEHFGRQLRAVVRLDCYFPYHGRAEGYETYLEQVLAAVETALPVRDISIGALAYHAETDCFQCPVTVRMRVLREVG